MEMLNKMLDSMKEFWYLWIVILVLLVVTVIVIKKTSKAVKKHSISIRQQEEEIKRFKYLVEKYKDISKEELANCDAAEVVEGITAVVQYRIEKSTDFDGEFKNSPTWEKTVYAFYYFAVDSESSLSHFFKNNGEPLPKLAVGGLKNINAENIEPVVSEMYAMYDENNEDVSIDNEKIEALNEKFSAAFDKDAFFAEVKNYIIGSK